MEIKTKFCIGDKVIDMDLPGTLEVKTIQVRVTSKIVSVMYGVESTNGDDYTYEEGFLSLA